APGWRHPPGTRPRAAAGWLAAAPAAPARAPARRRARRAGPGIALGCRGGRGRMASCRAPFAAWGLSHHQKKRGPVRAPMGGSSQWNGVASELEAEVQVVLAAVAIERMRQVAGNRRVLGVVLQLRVVEVERVEADGQPVGGLEAQRCRQRGEVVLVEVVGAADAGIE